MTEPYDDDPFYDSDDDEEDLDDRMPAMEDHLPGHYDDGGYGDGSYEHDSIYNGEIMSGIFREGERVKIVGLSSGHGVPLNTIMTVRSYNGMFVQVHENQMSFYEVDLQAVPYRLEDAEKQFNKAETEYIHAKYRLNYMKETGVTELSEAAFRKHVINNILTSDESLDDKTKKIEAIYGSNRRA